MIITDDDKMDIIEIILDRHPYFELNEVTESMHLEDDFGFDSLDNVELYMYLETHFDLKFDDSVFEKVGTIQMVFEVVEFYLQKYTNGNRSK